MFFKTILNYDASVYGFKWIKDFIKYVALSKDGQRGYCDRPIAMVIWMIRISGPQWVESFQNY